jgi:PAS domain S-box-containing protein
VGGILGLDLLLPLGVAAGILYVLPVLLGLWVRGRAYTLVVAAAASALCVAGFFLSPPGGVGETGIANRALSLFAVWTIVATVLAQKALEDRLRREREMSRDYLDVAGVAIVSLDASGRVTLVNRHGCELLGHEAHEIIGRDWFDLALPERLRDEVRRHFRRMIAGEEEGKARHENPVSTRSGEERWMVWHNVVLRDAAGNPTGTLSSGEDITDLRRSQESLAETVKMLQDFKYAIDQSAIVATTDRKGFITYANDKFCEISKYSRDELLGQDHRIVNSGYHPKDFMRQLWRTITSGRIWRGEIRNRAKDGTFYWVDTTIVPFLDSSGRPFQYVAIRSDITERKRAQEALVEQASLARMGEMAAVVAHEVKNPLAGIAGAMQIIVESFPAGSIEREMIGQMLARIDSLNRMIEDMLVFARPRPLRQAPLDLVPLLEDTKALLNEDPEHREVEVDLPDSAPRLEADPEQIHAVFLNLFINAAQAMGGSGRIRVSVHSNDGWCRVVVSDTGPGIPEDIRTKIFEPFFTTKHRGTGLGLAIARRVVIAHGGHLDIECPEQGGTNVVVTLPLRQPQS